MTNGKIKFFKTVALIAAAGTLASCYYGKESGSHSYKETCSKTSPAPIEFATQTATAAERAACEAADGSVVPSGLIGADMCVLPYCDAGEVCSDSSGCIGKCYTDSSFSGGTGSATTGVCQADSSPFGCRTEVVAGQAGPTLCVD